MNYRSTTSLLLLLGVTAWCLALPVSQPKVDSNVAKRTLDESSGLLLPAFNPYLPPYGLYPGIKPLRPLLPAGLFINRFATPAPPLDPVATYFKAKKDEFLNKLFNELSIVTEAPEGPEIGVRSVTDPTDSTEVDEIAPVAPTTPKPKVDPSVFITKKFDFLSQLFKSLNTTTPAPAVTVDPTDPAATTVKPTIVPPGFWVPFPKPPKPPKATKPPKPAKTKTLLLDAIDGALLKAMLSEIDPSNPALTADKVSRQITALDEPKKTARKASFLDELLHRVTDAPPTEIPPPPDVPSSPLEARSLFPPGYWIPPYIYAAKMGIYLDKIFDTIDTAAAANDDDLTAKRSATDPSSLILAELTALKNDMVTAYNEGIAAAKAPPTSTKPTPKSFKKPFWGPKTTPAPDPLQQKLDLLSDVFDKLAAVQEQLLAPGSSLNATLAPTVSAAPTPSYWAPDPTAPDISDYYKTKTQDFLSQLFAAQASATPATEP